MLDVPEYLKVEGVDGFLAMNEPKDFVLRRQGKEKKMKKSQEATMLREKR